LALAESVLVEELYMLIVLIVVFEADLLPLAEQVLVDLLFHMDFLRVVIVLPAGHHPIGYLRRLKDRVYFKRLVRRLRFYYLTVGLLKGV
jgi:hypothetical protein